MHSSPAEVCLSSRFELEASPIPVDMDDETGQCMTEVRGVAAASLSSSGSTRVLAEFRRNTYRVTSKGSAGKLFGMIDAE